MKKPWYQRLITSYLPWTLAGFLLFGSFLDTISKSLRWITPSITYLGTFLVIMIFLALTIALPRSRILWVTEDGNSVQIKAIGIKPVLTLTGILIALWMPRFVNTLQDNNFQALSATIVAVEKQRQSLEVTAASLETQHASIPQQPATNATQAALATQLADARATIQALQTLEAKLQYFTTNESMYCRNEPSSTSDTHWDFHAGETVRVLAKWYQDTNWLLVDINEPLFTRTDCCWVESHKGTLNVSLDQIKTTSIVPDRMDCSAIK